MNTSNHDPGKRRRDPRAPVLDLAFDEREWQAQERARLAARAGTAPAADDALAARYRQLSDTLRESASAPPADFAASVARHVLAERAAGEERVERWLAQALVAVLGLSGGVVSVLYGRDWLAAIGNALPSGSLSWLVLAAACAGMHWCIERWRGHRAAH